MALPAPANSDSCSRGEYTSHQNHQRRSAGQSRKLKASCDFCALSKVKCDRGRPQCMRCIRSELTCHYSESRRVGRARLMCAVSSSSSDSTGATLETEYSNNSPDHTRTSSGCETAQQDGERHATSMMSAAAAFPTPLPLDTSKWLDYDLSMEFLKQQSHVLHLDASKPNVDTGAFTFDHGLDFGMTNSVLEMPGLLGQKPLNKNYRISSHHHPEISGLGDLEKLEKMDLQQSTPCSPSCSSVYQTDDWQSSESSNLNDNQCIGRALAVFKVLHRAGSNGVQPKCDSTQSNGQRSTFQGVDAILTANRMAIETVLGSYCKLSAETLSAYMAQGQDDRASTSSSSSSSSSATSSAASGLPQPSSVATAFDVPFTIGGYVLKQAERDSIIKHVLRSEIEKMGDLITRIKVFLSAEDPLQRPLQSFIESLKEIQGNGLG